MTPRSVVITGASNGLGAALARRYAAPGTALMLVGRNRDALAQVCESCRARGAAVQSVALDVRERAGLAEHLLAFQNQAPIDLVIANAGVALAERDEDSTREVIDINLGGVLNTILPLIPGMQDAGAGQLALMSSIAAISPLPDAAAYSASKAALLAYGVALRQKLRPRGLRVNVICPGFIATGMGAQYRGWRPFEMSADAAAERIAAGLARDRAVIAFPWALFAAARLGSLVPEPVLQLAMRGFSFSIDPAGKR